MASQTISFDPAFSFESIYQDELSKSKLYSRIYTVAKYAQAIISKIISLPFTPKKIITTLWTRGRCPFQNAVSMTSEKLRDGIDKCIQKYGEQHPNIAFNRKALRVLETLDRIKQMHGIIAEFYFVNELRDRAPLSGLDFIACSPAFFAHDEDSIESILVHELAHIHFCHIYKKLALSVAEFALIFFMLMSAPNFAPAALIIMSIIESMTSKYFEKQADLWAMDQLHSNAGMTKFWKRCILRTQQMRLGTIFEITDFFEGTITEQQIFELQKAKVATDYSHPNFVTRYEYCLNYRPQ
jgi:hypothetical protein